MSVATKNPPARKRGVGRPVNADSERTKVKIIQSARLLMRKEPPSRVSKADIARAAGVDAALVNYHFGDLESVYLHVIDDIARDLTRHMEAVPTEGPAMDRLIAYIEAWFEVFLQDPHFNQLVVGQVFYGTRTESREFLQRSVRRVRDLEEMVLDGIQAGEFREIEPGYLFLSIIGLCELFMTAEPLVRALFGARGSMKQHNAGFRKFIVDLVLQGIACPRPPAAPPPPAAVKRARRRPAG